jgi:hypothetical protein
MAIIALSKTIAIGWSRVVAASIFALGLFFGSGGTARAQVQVLCCLPGDPTCFQCCQPPPSQCNICPGGCCLKPCIPCLMGPPEPGMGCCGQVPYDLATQQCCNGQVRPKPTWSWGCCGDTVYDSQTQLCCNGTPSPKPTMTSQCCGQASYDPALGQGCCSGQAYQPTTHQCCGGQVVGPDWCCCDNVPSWCPPPPDALDPTDGPP